jgi:hypothetical protein
MNRDDLYARATAVIDAKHDKSTARKRGALDTAILGTVPVLAVAVAFASGWSLYDLGRHFHMPGWAAWAVFALIDVVWFQSAIVVIKNQQSPHRAIEAHKRMQGMFAVSVAANFAHGLILFGATVNGFVAGAVFALFPIGFKAAFSNAFPDYVKRARNAGYGGELEKAFHTEALMFIMAGVDQVKAELGQAPDRPQVTVDRTPDRPESTLVKPPDQAVNQIEAIPEPAPVQPVQAAVNRPDQPVQTDDQVNELLRRLKLGEHITKPTAAKILGIPESTAYRRLTAAQALLNQYR